MKILGSDGVCPADAVAEGIDYLLSANKSIGLPRKLASLPTVYLHRTSLNALTFRRLGGQLELIDSLLPATSMSLRWKVPMH